MPLTEEQRLRPEGKSSAWLVLQRAWRLCLGLLKAIAFVVGGWVFLMGVSLVVTRHDSGWGWFLTLLPFPLWKIFWIWNGISWLSKKIWTFCETSFHYIQHRIWLSIAFWLAIMWYDYPWGSLVFILVNFVIGSPLSVSIARILAKFGIRIVPGCCCCHQCRH